MGKVRVADGYMAWSSSSGTGERESVGLTWLHNVASFSCLTLVLWQVSI
jgi:hypothetical protein